MRVDELVFMQAAHSWNKYVTERRSQKRLSGSKIRDVSDWTKQTNPRNVL